MNGYELAPEVERFYAAIIGLKEGFTRRAVIDERIPIQYLAWHTRHDWTYETLVHRSLDWHPIACVWIERSDYSPFVLTARWQWNGPNITRVSGDALCPDCRKSYYDHPFADMPQHLYEPVPGYGARPFLHQGCDGLLLKL